MTHVVDLACTVCGRTYRPEPGRYVCDDDGEVGTLDVRYDYSAIAAATDPPQTMGTMWDAPALPVEPDTRRPPLAVGGTPLYPAERNADRLGLAALWIKDEGRQPTGSLKDRASAMVLVKAAEWGAQVVATASTGNAAAALAGVGAAMGTRVVIFVPASAPEAKIAQLLAYGATVVLIDGSYDQAFDLCTAACERYGWLNRNTGLNPYTTEGKKTTVFEILTSLDWRPPDVIVVSVGDGSIIGGIHKGLADARELGWIESMPRLVGVQSSGSAYLVEAFERGEDVRTKPPAAAKTVADSISAALPRDRVKAMRAVTNSGGAFLRVDDEAILEALTRWARHTGVFAEPAAAAAFAGLERAVAGGLIEQGETVAVLSTGNGLKDVPAAMAAVEQHGIRPFRVAATMDSVTAALDELHEDVSEGTT